MKDKFLYGLIPTLIVLTFALSLGCLIAPLDAQADPTPTPETWQLSQYGYLGLPKAQVTFPTRLEPMCYDNGAWCEDALTNVEIKGMIVDWANREAHWFYVSDQGCYELVFPADGGFGSDNQPHPTLGAWWVECG